MSIGAVTNSYPMAMPSPSSLGQAAGGSVETIVQTTLLAEAMDTQANAALALLEAAIEMQGALLDVYA